MKTSQMKDSKYIKRDDLGETMSEQLAGIIVTVRGDVYKENLAMEGQPEEQKWVIEFEEIEKPMIINPVNIDMLSSLLGDDTETWNGQQVNLYLDPNVQMRGKLTGGLRFRSATPAAPRQPQTPRRQVPVAPGRPASNARPQRANEPEPNFDNVP
jgi:hypothetical protein